MNSDTDTTDQLRSLEISEIHDLFEERNFPATTDEILSEFDDVTVQYEDGDGDNLRTILETSGEETYENTDDLQLAILNGVQRGAVGRPRYSDRNPPTVSEPQDDVRSF